METLAELPCLLRAGFDPRLAGNHDNRAVSNTERLFHFADKIKESGSVENIDLIVIPLDRNQRCANGNSSLLLLLCKVGNGIAVLNLTHSGCQTAQIGHCFHQRGFAGAAVA